MSAWQQSAPLPHLWPPDRFEVRSVRPAPGGRAADRYHFPRRAHEAAIRLRGLRFATQIQVIRLADGATLFDLSAGVEVPVDHW